MPEGFYMKEASLEQIRQGVNQMVFHTLLLDTVEVDVDTEEMEVRSESERGHADQDKLDVSESETDQ